VSVFDVALDERDREMRRFIKRQVGEVRKAISTGAALPDPAKPVTPAPAVSPNTLLMQRHFEEPATGGAEAVTGIAETMEKALRKGVIGAAEAVTLRRAYGTPEWEKNPIWAKRLDEITTAIAEE